VTLLVLALQAVSPVIAVIALILWRVAVGRAETEKKRAEAETRRAEANAKRAEANAKRAEANAKRAEDNAKRAEDNAKRTFLTQLRAVSASASVSGSASADSSRRGLPLSDICPDLLDEMGVPDVSDSEVKQRWQSFLAKFRDRKVPRGRFTEQRFVHPVMALLISCALPANGALKVIAERRVDDSIDRDSMRPDFVALDARDATISSISTVIPIEAKLRNAMVQAMVQGGNYARRICARICEEVDTRGEDMSSVFTCFLVMCNKISFGRVQSGAPSPGNSFQHAVPCPSQTTPPVSLLEWDFQSAGYQPPATPPAGFVLLVRVLGASLAQLGRHCRPLQQLEVTWQTAGAGGVQLADGIIAPICRLGAGGVSDVYALECHTPGGCVLKLPRSVNARVEAQYATERMVLSALGGLSSHVPVLHDAGVRVQAGRLPNENRAPWPVLLLSPRGEPLAEEASRRVHRTPSGMRLPELQQFADAVLDGVLAALQLAHSCGWVHNDVRAANVVWADGRAVLVDWGLSLTRIAAAAEAGISGRLFQQRCSADIVGAALLWLQVVHGDPLVTPPWQRSSGLPTAWLNRLQSGRGVAVRDVVIRQLVDADTGELLPRSAVALAPLYSRQTWFGTAAESSAVSNVARALTHRSRTGARRERT
jgi:hypothetical protein